MKTTYNWIRKYCPAELSAEEMARRLSMSGCLIEEQHPLGDDTLFVAEVTSNRPDLLGTFGIAREVAALTGAPLALPPADFSAGPERIESRAALEVPAPDLCPRYTARLIRGVKVGPSPDWMRRRLEAIGLRPVNNVVDVTNYVLFECGQPLHTFDFDKLRGGKIIVRRAVEGEVLVSIDGTKCALKPTMLVIADAERPVAIAGIMGGLDTEISDATVNVLIESAQFENTNVRRTSRALGLASDASYRFERGMDPVQTEWASRRAAHLIQKVAGGTVDEGLLDVWAAPYEAKEVALRYSRVGKLLGVPVAPDVTQAILQRLGFEPVPPHDPHRVVVRVPPWRATDVGREADLIEEVIRIYGYDKIPETATLPAAVGRVGAQERVYEVMRRVLIGVGFHDVITNSFSEEAPARLFSPWTTAEPLTVQNTIRKDENRLRVSLLPGLLAVKRTNAHHGVPRTPLFETSRVFLPRLPRTGGAPVRDDRLPVEQQTLAILDEEDLLHLKGVIETLGDALGLPGRLALEAQAHPFFTEGMAARVTLDGKMIGLMGEVSREMREKFDLPRAFCAAEINLEPLITAASLDRKYHPLPVQPAAERDLAVVVDEAVAWDQIEGAIRALNIPILERIKFFDAFRGKQVPPGKKSLAFSLTFRAPDRTLTSEEVESARQACIASLAPLGAQLRA